MSETRHTLQGIALLIVAAPDLLEACEETLAEWDEENPEELAQDGVTVCGYKPDTAGIAMLRAAIAKATEGE